MAIVLRYSRSEIFDEFTDSEKKKYFSLVDKKFYAEIDNFYYSIFLDEENCKDEIKKFVDDLNKMREGFDFKSANKIDFHGLDFYPFGYKCYNTMLDLPECYDIFICSSLPNNKTPRIMVQLRSRYLWLHSPRKCISEAYAKVLEILEVYGIKHIKVQENRVDYAHHTNAIQSPEKFFDRPKLRKHCKTKARIYNLVGNPQNDFSLDYCSVGSRSSKSVFFRVYNKTREVIEQNYKSFFIDLWYKNKLISRYDKFCLEYAFNLKSYDVGVLCGQLHWYIEHGKNEALKNEFKELYKKYFADNINTAMIRKNVKKYIDKYISYDDINYVRKKVLNVLPPVTVILNIEFETHRDFYRSFDDSLLKIKAREKKANPLARVNLIYGCRNAFVEHLTRYGNTISFVQDNKIPLKEFDSSMYLAFWKRLRSAKWNTTYSPELYRSYERKMDIERAKRRIMSDAAVLSIHKNGINMNDATADFSDVFSLLNDNDIHMLFVDTNTGEIENARIKYGDHYTVKKRKNRQYRTIAPSPDQVEE